MDHTDVRDALHAATDDLPERDLDDGLWEAGRRRRRVRSAAGVTGTATAVAMVTVGAASVLGDSEPTGLGLRGTGL